ADLAGMGIAHRLARDGAQPESLGGVEAGALQPPVIEAEGLGLAIFEIELAVIGAVQGVGDRRLDPGAIERVEEQAVGSAEIGHGRLGQSWTGAPGRAAGYIGMVNGLLQPDSPTLTRFS